MSNSIKFFKGGSITKLAEYRRSYGSAQTTEVAYIVEENKHITVYSSNGDNRTFKKGTKLLVSFQGKREVKESTFKAWLNKVAKEEIEQLAERRLELDNQAKQRIENESKAIKDVTANVIENRIVFIGLLENLRQLKEEGKKDEWHISANQMVQFAFGERTQKWAISFQQVMQIIKANAK